MQDRAATSSDGVYVQLRCLQGDFGGLRLENMVVLATESAHVGRRSTHVEADHWRPGCRVKARLSISYNPARWSRENGSQTRKVLPGAKTTIPLHEQKLGGYRRHSVLESGAEVSHISVDQGRQVSIRRR